MEKTELKTFNELSDKYSTWIIKYRSSTFTTDIFLVYYTDANGNDKLLTYKSSEIFATTSLSVLKDKINERLSVLQQFENLTSWLSSFDESLPIEYSTYDINHIRESIDNNSLDKKAIEEFINLINLYRDFIQQSSSNKNLQDHSNNEIINQLWEYYYNNYIWNQKEGSLFTDNEKLLVSFTAIRKELENFIKLS